MILAKLKDARSYQGISPNLDRALQCLTPDFLSKLEAGRNEIDGDNVYCNRFSYETMPAEESLLEAHRHYIDIHVMLDGTERVEIASAEGLAPCKSDDEHGEYLFHGQGHFTFAITPGDFLVAFPSDAHKARVLEGKPRIVSKVVFKVKIQ